MTHNELQEMRNKMYQMKEEYEQTIQNFGKEMFNSATKELFEKNPKLDSFAWNQYTPYFNDGDECIFGVNRDHFTVNGTGEYLECWGIEKWKDPEYKYTPDPENYGFNNVDELISVAKGVSTVLDLFEDEDLKMMFGDHSEITVFRNGDINIDCYVHD